MLNLYKESHECQIRINDDALLKFKGVSVNGINEENLTLNVESDTNSDNHLRIRLNFITRRKPDWVYPVYNEPVPGVTALFRQGFGMGGPTGYLSQCDIDEALQKESVIYGYGLIVLKINAGYLAIYATDHERFNLRFDLQRDARTGFLRLSIGYSIEGTICKGDLAPLIFRLGPDLDKLLEYAAREIAGAYAPPVPAKPAYHWCSWYYYYNNFNLKQLEDCLKGLKTIYPPIPIEYMQIDAGYFPSAGDWLMHNDKWPGGLQTAFEMIRSYGYRPGIWIGPFMCGNRSALFNDHPDWMLKKKDGSRVIPWKIYNEPKVWGYQDEEYYVPDTSNPDVMAYMERVFTTLREWGAEFFKTDFLLWGMQDSNEVDRYAPGLTSVQYYRAFMDMVKKAIGNSYWLGCIAPMLPSLGYVNGMRIGGDVGAQWNDDGFGPKNMIDQIIGENYCNGIYWQNDPDAVIIRDFHVFLKENEIEALALLQAISGGMIYTSDPLHLVDKKRLVLFRFLRPGAAILKPIIPTQVYGNKLKVLYHRYGKRYIILLFNPDKENHTAYYPLREIINEDKLYVKEWKKETLKIKVDHICTRVPAHGAVLFFAEEKPIVKDPETIWSL